MISPIVVTQTRPGLWTAWCISPTCPTRATGCSRHRAATGPTCGRAETLAMPHLADLTLIAPYQEGAGRA